VIRPCEDWRRLASADAGPLIEAEARRWRAELGWNVDEAWKAIEPARAAGHLPGLVVRDPDGRVAGWSCFLLHRQTLQVAMIVADGPDKAAALVEGVLASPEAARATTYTVCVRDAAPGVRGALRNRGFDVATYRYLRAPLDVPGAIEPPCRAWEIEDATGMARLCARAYAETTEVRAFAPHGTIDEWHEYIATLVTSPGCGRFLPLASFAIPGRQTRRPDGAVVTTDLGTGTAHIAQVAVDPDARGRGWGRALVASAMSASAAAGFRQMTLLVAETNARATALYADMGFRDQSSFVVAVRRQPRKLRRVVLEEVGAWVRSSGAPR
jgi:ribosomal protein S18 acetylase RimI-like enzyme